jgi:hypothetical protein
MIRDGGSSARATTQSENGHRPAKARDRPASAIRQSLLSRRFVAASLVRGIWIVSESYESDPDERG